MEKLDELDEKELLLEVAFLRATVTPNIRQKRKVDGKFVTFTKEELKSQIKNVIQPVSDLTADLGTLLSEVYKPRSVDRPLMGMEVRKETEVDGIKPGMVGWWTNAAGERKVGIVLDEDSIQMYTPRRYGYAPFGLPDTINNWVFSEEISEFIYVQKKCGIYLVL